MLSQSIMSVILIFILVTITFLLYSKTKVKNATMHTLIMNYKGTHHYNYFSHQRQNFTPEALENLSSSIEVLFGSWHPFGSALSYPSFNTGVSQIEKISLH